MDQKKIYCYKHVFDNMVKTQKLTTYRNYSVIDIPLRNNLYIYRYFLEILTLL